MNRENPFSTSIVVDPWTSLSADVPQLHARAFTACQEALADVRRGGISRGVLIHGEPGSGKTHLLARLREHWSRRGPDDAESFRLPPLPPILFSALRLRSGCRMLCRYVRRALIGDLLRPVDQGLTQLDWLVIYRTAPYVNYPERAHRWWLRLRRPGRESQSEAEIRDLLQRLDRRFQLGGNLCTALRLWALGRHRRAARDWLAEAWLPDDDRQALGFVTAPDDADPEEEALDLIEALTRLAGEALPLVIGFDQVEALQAHPGDLEGPFAFGRMVSALHDRTRYTLLVTMVQQTFLETMQEAIRVADMDRVAETAEVLEPLDAELAPALVAARLEAAETFRNRPERAADRCWPIGEQAVRQFVATSGPAGCTARRVLAWCREQLDELQNPGRRPRVSTEQFLERRFESLLEESLRADQEGADKQGADKQGAEKEGGEKDRSEQEGTDQERAGQAGEASQTLHHGLPLLLVVAGKGRIEPAPRHEVADLLLHRRDGPVSVCILNETGIRLTHRLKRIREYAGRHAGRRLLLLRDSRLRIPPTSRRAHEHLRFLADRGVPLVQPSVEAVAALDALRSLLSDAKSGDLAHGTETVQESTVRQWLEGRLPTPVKQLLRELLPNEQPDGQPDGQTSGRMGAGSGLEDPHPLYAPLLALLRQHHVLRLAEAAERLEADVDQLVGCVDRHRACFGVLAGPPIVLYERLDGVPSATEPAACP